MSMCGLIGYLIPLCLLAALQKLRGTMNVQVELSDMKAFSGHKKTQVSWLQKSWTQTRSRPLPARTNPHLNFTISVSVISVKGWQTLATLTMKTMSPVCLNIFLAVLKCQLLFLVPFCGKHGTGKKISVSLLVLMLYNHFFKSYGHHAMSMKIFGVQQVRKIGYREFFL